MKNQDKIRIAVGIEVEANMPYKQRAELLLEKLEEKIRAYGGDNKCYINVEGIESLIGAGAEILNLNRTQHGRDYLHEVTYKGRRFISATKEPFIYRINALLK